ncbi:MAG: hypothetical protein H7240_09115 [Glaciimonas sp.]|nr:hypothetical protein [Glaciimonas sp.]
MNLSEIKKMTGLLSQPITPTCRYEHGDLQIMMNPSGGTGFMSPEAGVMMGIAQNGSVSVAPSAYVYAIYKCKKCSYLEFHDISPGTTQWP